MISPGSVSRFLKSMEEWAKSRSDIDCVLLIGSYARGEQTENSDIDLMILTENADWYLENTAWVSEFGNPRSMEMEDWGDVQSVRVWYTDSNEIEFGVSSPSWLDDPLPATTAKVLEKGYEIIFANRRIRLPKPDTFSIK